MFDKRCFCSAVLFGLLAVSGGVAALSDAACPIVTDGAAQAVVVRNTEGGAVSELAVAELLDHISGLTGVRLPQADAKTWDRMSGKTAIIVGRGALLDELGVETGKLAWEGYRILSLPERRILVLAGRDAGSPFSTSSPMNQLREFGTLYAVYDLLEQWGVRWLFPGRLGTVIPRQATLAAPRIDRTEAPDFRRRNLWTREEEPREKLKDAGSPQRAARLWALRNRSGNSTDEYASGHHSPRWWNLWAESNPAYLGLFRGDRGWRRIPPGLEPDRMPPRSKPCLANPAVVEAVANLALAAFRRGARTYSICEQDGTGGFCTCEACVALDGLAEGEVPYGSGPAGIYSDLASARVNLTDRHITFWNRVAERVATEFPDRHLGVYLYTFYSDLPRREQRLHPMLRAVYVNNGQVEPAELRRRLTGWSRLTPHPVTMYIPPMFGAWPLQDYAGVTLPVLTLGNVHEGIRFCRGQRIAGALLNPNFNTHNVGSHGVMAYAYARWLWDADRTPDEVLADFCRHAFGAAAGMMQAYFKAIEARQTASPLPFVVQEGAGRDRWLDHHLGVFTPAFVAEQRGRLDQAVAQAEVEAERERVQLFRQNLDFTAAQLGLEVAWRAFRDGRAGIDPVLDAYRACEELYAALWPENRPGLPLFRRGDATRAAVLASHYVPLRVLSQTDWKMRADPYGEGVAQRWFAVGDDGGGWRPVDMDAGYDMQGLHGSGLRVWYRTRFHAPADWPREGLRLGFRASNTSGELYLNGRRIGQQILGEGTYAEPELDGGGRLVSGQALAGNAPYVYDIGRAVNPGATNELVVTVWGFADRGVGFQRTWLLRER